MVEVCHQRPGYRLTTQIRYHYLLSHRLTALLAKTCQLYSLTSVYLLPWPNLTEWVRKFYLAVILSPVNVWSVTPFERANEDWVHILFASALRPIACDITKATPLPAEGAFIWRT